MGRAVLSQQRDEQGNRSPKKKTSESQKAKALWAAEDREEEYDDPACKDNIW